MTNMKPLLRKLFGSSFDLQAIMQLPPSMKFYSEDDLRWALEELFVLQVQRPTKHALEKELRCSA